MTLWDAKTKAEAEFRQAKRAWLENPTQRNTDRLRIKMKLLEGLQRWIAERSVA